MVRSPEAQPGAAGYSLPQRATRGRRLAAALDDADDADAEFWNQEFFAEEAQDEDYQQEEEQEDVVDSDFDEPEDDEEDEEQEVREVEVKRKVLKPPEPKAKPRPKPAPKAAPEAQAAADEDEDERAAKRLAADLEQQQYKAPTLRRSTVAKVAQAEQHRVEQQTKTVRKTTKTSGNWRPMSQKELLEEAARTEVENIQSLKLLMAIEEETKRKAIVEKKKYTGPMVKFKSTKKEDHTETAYELHNMHYPPAWLRRLRPQPAPPKPVCAVTGQPAKYRDPVTGMPFADAPSFKRLRGLPAGHHHHNSTNDQAQQQQQQQQQVLAGGGWQQGVDALGMQHAAEVAAQQPRQQRAVLQHGIRSSGVQPAMSAVQQHELQQQHKAWAQPPSLMDLPPDMMALVMDVHKTLGQGAASGRGHGARAAAGAARGGGGMGYHMMAVG